MKNTEHQQHLVFKSLELH